MTSGFALLVVFSVVGTGALSIGLIWGLPTVRRLMDIRRREQLIKKLAALDQPRPRP